MGKKKTRQPQPLTDETIDEMWSAYNEDQRVQSVAKSAGVAWATAKRYIEKGNPKRSVEAFKPRLARVRRQAADEADYDLAKAIAENLRIIRPIKQRLATELGQQMERGRQRVRNRKIMDPAGEILGLEEETVSQDVEIKASDLTQLTRLELSLLGEPDEVIEVRIKAVAGLFFALMRAEGISDDKILHIAERVDDLGPPQMDAAARKVS